MLCARFCDQTLILPLVYYTAFLTCADNNLKDLEVVIACEMASYGDLCLECLVDSTIPADAGSFPW